MQRVLDAFSDLSTSWKVVSVVGGVSIVLVTTVTARKLLNKKKKVVYPRDTLILHQIGRGPYAPSLSPFVLKLETYLRIANIPYQVAHNIQTPGKKGKWPWIQYNDDVVADSEFCIDYLNSTFNVDINRHLTTHDRGVAQGIKVMADEHIVWCLAMFRYIYDEKMDLIRQALSLSGFMVWYFRRVVGKVVWYQGMGRHGKEEVTIIFERDLQALADVLGQKKFLFGDKPCVADCSVFGHLAQLYWHCVGSDDIIRDKYPTLVSYLERIKTTYWPDWDQCITHGFTAEATK